MDGGQGSGVSDDEVEVFASADRLRAEAGGGRHERRLGVPAEGSRAGERAALAGMLAFNPADEIEAMIAAQATAMHPEQPADTATRLGRDGASLARGMTETVDAPERKRGRASQQVRVEHDHVQDGGQAIVSSVTAAPRGGLISALVNEPYRPPSTLDHDAAPGPGNPLAAARTPGGRARASVLPWRTGDTGFTGAPAPGLGRLRGSSASAQGADPPRGLQRRGEALANPVRRQGQ